MTFATAVDADTDIFELLGEQSQGSISADSLCEFGPQHRSCDIEHMVARSKL